ncbi:hypothetical protein B0J11DRAFT_441730 [Dendryphion nanum]|uniref:Uncharacterized protein n=1 Tax=Dendryphion nanum TaxID=256645 RepID=A0A9P9IFF7_9PLEO|nr:hypothetical protein B0J11DRAFT_441730 [Dendryphion nanum]
MRAFTSLAVLAFVITVAGTPITPAAPKLQRRAEEMRSTGMAEHDIAKQLTLPLFEQEEELHPLISQVSEKFYKLFKTPENEEKRDLSGDIPPGSLESPQMLPRVAAPESLTETLSKKVHAVFGNGDIERRGFGYEGKELEMRRPQGMRHWD